MSRTVEPNQDAAVDGGLGMSNAPAIKALLPWYGSNRLNAKRVGLELRGCAWVGVPFAGSMSELLHIDARTILVADLHRHLINLARVVSHPVQGPMLYRLARRLLFHPDQLKEAQAVCAEREVFSPDWGDTDRIPDVDWALAYFVVCWMGRSAVAGTKGEFRGGIATRWDASGGDSAKRWQSAIRSLPAWRRVLRRCTFEVVDCFDFLGRVKDHPGHGLYCDPPWPDAGDSYRHTFTEDQQRQLAAKLADFKHVRVVVRYGDHPIIRELYPRDRWTWIEQASRSQANGEVAEVLIVNGAGASQCDWT